MFTGFAWNPVGVAFVDTRFADFARVIGTYGVSGATLLFSGMIMLLVAEPRRKRLIWVGVALAGAVMIAHFTRGEPLAAPALPVRIVQPNLGQQDKWREGLEERHFARLRRLSGPAGGDALPFVWPRAAGPPHPPDGRTTPHPRRP